MDSERQELASGADRLGVALDEPTTDRMLTLLDLLEKWNRAYNLTAVRERAAMCSRHLLDSLSLVPMVHADHILDLGAGGGFPGLVLALHSPHREVTLIDSNSKKTRFLTQCKLELGLDNVTVVHSRVDDYSVREPFEQITSRAFASLAEMVPMAAHLLAQDGEYLAMKGPEAMEEASLIPSGWTLAENRRVEIPGVSAERRLLRIRRHHPGDSATETGD
jgi:16S rRNA (guanine527-N7)-methyltransferase